MSEHRIFLLSPAHCGGKRAALLLREHADFDLARRLRAGWASLGEVFSFVSGLYFRGKLGYSSAFARPPEGLPGALVITPDRGLALPAAPMTLGDLASCAEVPVDLTDARYREPLARDVLALSAALPADCEVVLLGSIATGKYFELLLETLGARLSFPADFVGRGDMSRGALMLEAVRRGEELTYVRAEGAIRWGPRAPGVDTASAAAARARRAAARSRGSSRGVPDSPAIPAGRTEHRLRLGRRELRLTNLQKMFFPAVGATKRDLLQYYADMAPVLVPHLKDRASVMKRYPNGVEGEFFFMKRTPAAAPEWIERCIIEHASGNVIDFPMAQDAASLLWMVNLGCIDINPWYARCDDVNRPDFLHFDLDPVPPAGFERVREVALLLRDALRGIGARSYAKTTGSRGMHIYVPIVRSPTQKQVWGYAREVARALASHAPALITAEYRIARRPPGRVLVDYNQNAWGRTLASVYSVRARPLATVSTPVSWDEVERGIAIEDFTLLNVPVRVAALGDLWKPLLARRGRFDLQPFLEAA